MNPQKRRTTGKYKVAEDHFCQGVKKNTPSLSGKGEKKRKGRGGGTELFRETASTCYPLGQFSTYRLDKISPPPPKPHPQPHLPLFWDKLDPPIGEEKFYLAAPTPKWG